MVWTFVSLQGKSNNAKKNGYLFHIFWKPEDLSMNPWTQSQPSAFRYFEMWSIHLLKQCYYLLFDSVHFNSVVFLFSFCCFHYI